VSPWAAMNRATFEWVRSSGDGVQAAGDGAGTGRRIPARSA